MNPLNLSLHGAQRQDVFTHQLLTRLAGGERQVAEKLWTEVPELADDEELVIELLFREFLYYEETHLKEGTKFEADAWVQRYPKHQKRLQRLRDLYDAIGDETKSQVTETIRRTAHESGTIQAGTSSSPRPVLAKSIGQYEIIELINRGGMGVVYRAQQTTLDRNVALKVIEASRLEPKQLRMFQKEAEAGARFTHPNIVQVYEIGQQDDRAFISMELVEGGDLADRTRNQPLDPRQAATLLKTLALAMHAAHQHGIIHRDLKPGNILLSNKNNLDGPKIADFGLAKHLHGEQSHFGKRKEVIGTPAFMAPENAAGAQTITSTAVDIYGLGAIFYQCLTGRVPFEGDSIRATLKNVQEQPIVPPRELSRMPADVEAICLKCLNKKPEDRYQTSQELASDLQNFLDRKATIARPLPAWKHVGKWMVRRPAMATLLFLAVAMSVTAAAGFIRYQQALVKHANETDQLRQTAKRDIRQLRAALKEMDVMQTNLRGVPQQNELRTKKFADLMVLYETFLEEHQNDPSLWPDIRNFASQVSDASIQFADFEVASEMLYDAVRFSRKTCESEDATAHDRMVLAADLHTRGWLNRKNRNPDQSCKDFEECRHLYQVQFEATGNQNYMYAASNAKTNLAEALLVCGKRDEADRLNREATDYFGERFKMNPRDFGAGLEYTLCLDTEALSARFKRDYRKALEIYEDSLEVRKQLQRLRPGDEGIVEILARSYSNIARLHRHLGDDQAMSSTAKAVEAKRKILQIRPKDLEWKKGLSGELLFLARLCSRNPETHDNARLHYEDIIRLRTEIATKDMDDEKLTYQLADILLNCPIEELRDADRALQIVDGASQKWPKQDWPRHFRVFALYAKGNYVGCLQSFRDLLPFRSTPRATITALIAVTRLRSIAEVRAAFSGNEAIKK